MSNNADKQNPVRLAIIASEHASFTYSIFLEHFFPGLADRSIPVAFVCPQDYEISFSHSLGTELIRYPLFKLPFFNALGKKLLIERLADFHPTVLLCLCDNDSNIVRMLARRLSVPYILNADAIGKFNRSAASSKRCAKVVAAAGSIAAGIKKFYPQYTDKLTQINIGTFTEDTAKCFKDSSRLPAIVTTHPLDNVHDFELLFAAMKRLALNDYEFILFIRGGGQAESQIRKLLALTGLLPRTFFIPHQEPWRNVLLSCDVFIRPRPLYVFDPLLLEAMAVGLTVAGCKGGVDDLIIDGRTAVVFDENNEISISSTLQKLFDARQFAQKTASNAQDLLRQEYTVSSMIDKFVEVLLSASENQSNMP